MSDIDIICDELPDFLKPKPYIPLHQLRWTEKQEMFKHPFELRPYDEILTFANLYRAYEKTRIHKSNRDETEEYEKHLIENLNILYDLLLAKQWKDIYQYHRFYITVPKPRKIDALDFSGRITLHLMCDNGLDEWFDRRLVKECAACRKGMGTDYAKDLMEEHLYDYYLKYVDVLPMTEVRGF